MFFKKGEKRDRASKKWIMATLIVLLVAIILMFISLVFYNKSKTTASQVNTSSAAIKLRQSDTVGGEGSPKYNQDLIEYGNIGAEKAQREGKDYIPPVVREASNNALAIDEPKKEEVVVVEKESILKPGNNTPKPAETARPSQTQQQAVDPRENLLKNAVLSELSAISERMTVQGHTTEVFANIKEQGQDRQPASTQMVNSQESLNSMNVMADLGVKPGDVFYAITRETLNSDAPGTRMTTAEILSGKLKGYRVVGSFVRENEHLVVRYSKIVSPDDISYVIEGFAVDPSTKSAGVRSSVDHHYLSRWGGLVAASFLQGFGNAVASSGVSSDNRWGDSVITSTPNYSAVDQAWIAASKVGEVMSDKASKNFDRVPTVTLSEGLPIGVLIIDIENKR